MSPEYHATKLFKNVVPSCEVSGSLRALKPKGQARKWSWWGLLPGTVQQFAYKHRETVQWIQFTACTSDEIKIRYSGSVTALVTCSDPASASTWRRGPSPLLRNAWLVYRSVTDDKPLSKFVRLETILTVLTAEPNEKFKSRLCWSCHNLTTGYSWTEPCVRTIGPTSVTTGKQIFRSQSLYEISDSLFLGRLLK
jgi:hypothetical protein